MAIQTINPSTGERIHAYPEASPADVRAALEDAAAAFTAWRATPFQQRAALMRDAANVLRRRQGEYAALMATEMGKPLQQGLAEAEKCAWVCEYYAEHAAAQLGDEPVHTDASRSFVAFRPIGVVLAVMPWNFPFWQVFRFAAPGLMAGNAAVLKHSSNVMGCALAIEEVFREAGFPDALFQALVIGSARVREVVDAPQVKAVTLTGSGPAGRAVAAVPRSRRPCSSWAAAIPMSFWRMRTSRPRCRRAWPRASSTAGRAVLRRSDSSWSTRFGRHSSDASWR